MKKQNSLIELMKIENEIASSEAPKIVKLLKGKSVRLAKKILFEAENIIDKYTKI